MSVSMPFVAVTTMWLIFLLVALLNIVGKCALQMVEIKVWNLDCEGCATKIHKALHKVKGKFILINFKNWFYYE